MTSPDRTYVHSYILLLILFIVVVSFKLTTALLAVLFTFLVLRVLHVKERRWIAVVLTMALLTILFYVFMLFGKSVIATLPHIVASVFPEIMQFAKDKGIELPFSDMVSLKELLMEGIYSQVGFLSNFAKLATKESVFVIVGIVVGFGIYVNPRIDYAQTPQPLNLYSLYAARLAELFTSFFHSFQAVMGAQVIISGINTFLTFIFVYATDLPHPQVVIVLTFLCGLLPVVGNILSNSLIVGIAFTVSPRFAGGALLYLITIHKLEYFLNSKIIGSRIRHPMWLMLLALILGERLMGIAGIILAPVILHFLKTEASRFKIDSTSQK